MPFTLGNRTFFVPGAYAITKIINQGGNVIPQFNVGVIIGAARQGLPYTLGDGATPAKTADVFIQPFADVASAKRQYGSEGDSEIITALRYAKAAGAGTVYMLNVRPVTAVTAGEINNGAPAHALTVSTTNKQYGAHANDISITIAASVHTIIPPKNVTYLSANASSGQPTVTVNDVLNYKAGDTVLVVANNVVAESHVIDTVNPTAKTITFTSNLTGAPTTAQYARIFQEDTENQEVSSEALTTVDKVLAFYANSAYLTVTVETGITLMPVTLAKTYVGALTSAVKATTPAVQASDWQAVADEFARWNEEFALVNKTYMRLLHLVTSDAANHAAFVTLATTLRGLNKPIALVTGAALGDYALGSGDGAYPANRAATLNSDEVQLAGFGADGYGGYLSYAGYIFGTRCAQAVNHNQTGDILGGGLFATVEKAFYRDDPALETLVKAGVMSIMMDKTGYKIVQGATTYQDQSTTFNANTKKTYLVMLRDLADFDLRVMMELLDQFAGADQVTREAIASAVVTSSDVLQNNLQYISGYTIQAITKKPSGWEVQRSISIDSPTDFIGLVNSIVID